MSASNKRTKREKGEVEEEGGGGGTVELNANTHSLLIHSFIHITQTAANEQNTAARA